MSKPHIKAICPISGTVVEASLTEGSVQVGETGRYVNIPHYTCDECGSVIAIPAGVRVYKEDI